MTPKVLERISWLSLVISLILGTWYIAPFSEVRGDVVSPIIAVFAVDAIIVILAAQIQVSIENEEAIGIAALVLTLLTIALALIIVIHCWNEISALGVELKLFQRISYPVCLATTILLSPLAVLSHGKPEKRRLLTVAKMIKEYEEAEDVLANEVVNLRGMLNEPFKAAKRERIPFSVKEKILERSEYACEYCGGVGTENVGPDRREWHIDHVVAVHRGGPTNLDNLTLSCETCNLRKGSMPPYLFVRRLIQEARQKGN